MKISRMRITADRDVCIGAGMCVMNAEEVFDQDDGGIVVLLEVEVPPEHADAAARAVASCPSGALRRID
jgi:ferredoxin